MKRRTFLRSAGAAGIAAIGLSTAGCLGEDTQQNPQSDEPLQSQEWLFIEGKINREKMDDALKITQSSLFRTANGFGVFGTVKNIGNQPYDRVVIHVKLINANDEVIDTFVEQATTDVLGPGEVWNWQLIFEEADPEIFLEETGGNQSNDAQQTVVSYQVWATGNLRGTNNAGGSGNTTSGNATGGTTTDETMNGSG